MIPSQINLIKLDDGMAFPTREPQALVRRKVIVDNGTAESTRYWFKRADRIRACSVDAVCVGQAQYYRHGR
jgi:hypothetical protein